MSEPFSALFIFKSAQCGLDLKETTCLSVTYYHYLPCCQQEQIKLPQCIETQHCNNLCSQSILNDDRNKTKWC